MIEFENLGDLIYNLLKYEEALLCFSLRFVLYITGIYYGYSYSLILKLFISVNSHPSISFVSFADIPATLFLHSPVCSSVFPRSNAPVHLLQIVLSPSFKGHY